MPSVQSKTPIKQFNINTESIMEKLEGGELCASAINKAMEDQDRSPITDAILEWIEKRTTGSDPAKYLESSQPDIDQLGNKIVEITGIAPERLNFSESIKPGTLVVQATHFAPKNDMSYKDPTGNTFNRVNPNNPCIRQLLEVIPAELVAEAMENAELGAEASDDGFQFTSEMMQRVRETVCIVDCFPYIPDNTKNPHKDFFLFAQDCNTPLDLLYAIGWIRIYEHVHYNMLQEESSPLSILCMSRATSIQLFGCVQSFRNKHVDLDTTPHPQNYLMKFPLRNPIWNLEEINEAIRKAYKPILQPFCHLPDVSKLSHRIGKIGGFRMSTAGFKISVEVENTVYAKHREETTEAWVHERNGEILSPAHQIIVDRLRRLHNLLSEARERRESGRILTKNQAYLLAKNEAGLERGRDTISEAFRRRNADLPLDVKQDSIVTRIKAGLERGRETIKAARLSNQKQIAQERVERLFYCKVNPANLFTGLSKKNVRCCGGSYWLGGPHCPLVNEEYSAYPSDELWSNEVCF
jgi:hypothetical protein